MQIHGFNKTTLLDYPEHIAATVFTGGCNFRCPFCHNGELVLDPGLPAAHSGGRSTLLPEKKAGDSPGGLRHRRRADSAKGSEGFFTQDQGTRISDQAGYQWLYAGSIVESDAGASD